MNARQLKRLIALVSVFAGGVVAVSPPALLSQSEGMVAALVIVAISFWVTGIIPEHLTAILLFAVAMLFSIAPANIVFSGFHSAAFWLVFSGLVIGVGINVTGLGKRIAEKIAAYLDGSYLKLIGGLVSLGLLFAFLMPSGMGRVVLLVPIAIAISKHFGFQRGSNGFNAVILSVVLGSFLPAFSILPANVPNMILAGLAESLHEYTPLYGEYLLLHFPVLGLIKAIAITALIVWLYPDKPTPRKAVPEKSTQPISAKEKNVRVVLLILIVLWMTDFIHHVSPAWVALAGALYLLIPSVDIVSKQQFAQDINYGSLFFIAGILGLGNMISSSGLGTTSAQYLTSSLPLNLDTPFINFVSIGLSSMLTGVVTTLPGVPAVMTPLSSDLAQASGFSINSVSMMQVFGFSTAIFPYQAPPILIGMQLAQVELKEAMKVCLYLAVISVVFLLPVDYFWWKLLGWL
jgi:anion transporter